MLVRDSDLTSYARIRNAALEGFAAKGVGGTSIRDVAKAAGVSPGLVQHHFPTKAALRDAVDGYVIEAAREVWAEISDADDGIAQGARQITAFAREHPPALLYVARSAAEGDDAGLAIFDAFVDITEEQLGRLARDKVLDPELDQHETAVHLVVFCFGAFLFEAAIDRHLPQALRSPEGLDRWGEAAADLLQRAGLRSSARL